METIQDGPEIALDSLFYPLLLRLSYIYTCKKIRRGRDARPIDSSHSLAMRSREPATNGDVRKGAATQYAAAAVTV